MKKKYLLITDLDGTFLNKNCMIDFRVKKELNSLYQNDDVLFTFATVRDYIDSQKIVKGVKINIPLILCNGGVVFDLGMKKIIHGFFYPEIVATNIIDYIYRNRIPANITYSENNSLKRAEKEKSIISYREKKIISFALFENIQQIQNTKRKIDNFFCNTINTCIYTNHRKPSMGILEILPKDTNKGKALQFLLRYLDMKIFTISFGNDHNDIELIKNSDYGVAVGKSIDIFKNNYNLAINYDEGKNILPTFLHLINQY